MNAFFESVVDKVIAAEKGYVDHPSDKGGPTNFGITQTVARANGYVGDMRLLPLSLARTIYKKRYIVEPRFDQVSMISEAIGTEMIDTGVNMGPATAAIWLQRWVNGFNAGGSRYADVFVDGRIGPVTLNSLQMFLEWRGKAGVTAMLRGLNGVQAAKYLALAEADKSQRDFLFGWVMNRVEM